MRKFILFISVISFCFGIKVYSFNEHLEQISFDTALNLAKKNNPQILNANIEYEIAKNNIQIVSAWQNPHFVSDFFIGNVAKGNTNQLGLLFPIEVAKRKLRKEIAAEKADIQKLQAEKIIISETNYLYFIYFSLVINKELYKLEEIYKKILADKQINDNNYKSFLIIKHDRTLQALKDSINKNRETLNNLINKNNSYIVYDTIDTDIYNFNLDSNSFLNETSQNLEIEKNIMEKEISTAYKNIQLTKNERIPDILAGGGFAFEYGNKPYAADYSGAFISVDLEVPLLNFIAPNIRNSELRYEQAKLKKAVFEDSIRNNAQTKLNRYNILVQNFQQAKEDLLKFKASEDKEIIYMTKKDYLKCLNDLINFYFNNKFSAG